MRRSILLGIIVALLLASSPSAFAQQDSERGGLFAPLDRFGERLLNGVFAKDPEDSRLPGRTPQHAAQRQPTPASRGVSSHGTAPGTESRYRGRPTPAPAHPGFDQRVGPTPSRTELSGVSVVSPSDSEREVPAGSQDRRFSAEDEDTSSEAHAPLHQRLMTFRRSAFGATSPAPSQAGPSAELGTDDHMGHTHAQPQSRPPSSPAPAADIGSSAQRQEPTLAPPLDEGPGEVSISSRPSEPTVAQEPPPAGLGVLESRAAEPQARKPQLGNGQSNAATSLPKTASGTSEVTANRSRHLEEEPAATESRSPNVAAPRERGTGDPADPERTPLSSGTSTLPMAPPSLQQRGTSVAPSGPTSRAQSGGAAVGEPAGHSSGAAEITKENEGEMVLIDRHSPNIQIRTLGPRRISVGKEGVYEIVVGNAGTLAAEQVTLYVNLPEWADLVSAEASTGATNVDIQPAGRTFRWKISHLLPEGKERLKLRIVPQQSKAFDLSVNWDFVLPSSQTKIEVQEAKLELKLDGPGEILYGESAVYRLELANVGTGAAENLTLALLPTGQESPASVDIGTLPAGEKKVIEVELTARQTGELSIQIDAQADAGAQAHLSETIAVLRPALQVEVDGPAAHFVGKTDTFVATVHNPGTAEAKDVQLAITLPETCELVDYQGDARMAEDNRTVQWNIGSLPAGDSLTRELTCRFTGEGDARLTAVSTASGKLNAADDLTTAVAAVADLRLSVNDPAGPIPVGETADYQVIVENRGTKAAEQIKVIGYFSRGIEPQTADGQSHRLLPGQVVFEPIAFLAPGEKKVLTVSALAETGGNHVFRAELSCEAADIRLVAEESTHYFGSPNRQTGSRYAERQDGEQVR